jgi:hypothetical protein
MTETLQQRWLLIVNPHDANAPYRDERRPLFHRQPTPLSARFHCGEDKREKLYSFFRAKKDAGPVLLK